MSLVNLVSGGLDSTLVSSMAVEEGLTVFPLFIDYGQKAASREWEACQLVHKQLGLPTPIRMGISGFGSIISSGLTSQDIDVKDGAFTPGRNLLFLVIGSAYAFQVGANAVAIGLLSEQFSFFPDQKEAFIKSAEQTIKLALGRAIRIITPLSDFCKPDVVRLATQRGISDTYSCHLGQKEPCGLCLACREYQT